MAERRTKKMSADEMSARFTEALTWYAETSAKLDTEFIKAKGALNEMFNQKITRIRNGQDSVPLS